jgi:hypothetical protein
MKGILGVHQMEYLRDEIGRVIMRRYLDKNGQLANRKANGIAQEVIKYQTYGSSKTSYLDLKGELISN